MSKRLQPPPSEPSPARRPHWLLFLAAALVLLFIAQKIGCGPIQTEEKIEWIDR